MRSSSLLPSLFGVASTHSRPIDMAWGDASVPSDVQAQRDRIGSPDDLPVPRVDQAAVDEQFGAGGVGGIGSEVEGCCSDFGGGAGASERNAALGPLDEVVLLSRCETAFVEDWGNNWTGADGVDPDAARRQLLCDRASE